ncbi:MAG: division/cell wall cluster transcriptional repressor MraZ [Alphaproteobacteria bacterium]
MALFLSTFINKVDSKGRVYVPSQFRASLVNGNNSAMVVYESFINQSIEGCDLERIKKLSESIDNLEPFSEERDAFATAVLGGSVQLSIDGDGRIILPENLLKTAKIKDSAVFIGKGATFEIWEPISFEKYMQKAKEEAKLKRNLLRLKNDK